MLAQNKNAQTHPRRENICAIFVTFFPDALFAQRIEKIRKQVGKILIVDNTADANCRPSSQHLGIAEIEIIHNKENLGVGEALNQGLARAIQLGYPWAITFDQDSWAHDDLIICLISIAQQQSRP